MKNDLNILVNGRRTPGNLVYLWLSHRLVNAGVALVNLLRFDGISSWARLTDTVRTLIGLSN